MTPASFCLFNKFFQSAEFRPPNFKGSLYERSRYNQWIRLFPMADQTVNPNQRKETSFRKNRLERQNDINIYRTYVPLRIYEYIHTTNKMETQLHRHDTYVTSYIGYGLVMYVVIQSRRHCDRENEKKK